MNEIHSGWMSGRQPTQPELVRDGFRLGVFAVAGCGDDDGDTVVNPNEPGPEPASVTVEPTSLSLVVGGTARLAVTVRDRNGDELSPEATWSSASESVTFASSWAEASGLVQEVRATGVGATILTATAGAAADSVQVTVTR